MDVDVGKAVDIAVADRLAAPSGSGGSLQIVSGVHDIFGGKNGNIQPRKTVCDCSYRHYFKLSLHVNDSCSPGHCIFLMSAVALISVTFGFSVSALAAKDTGSICSTTIARRTQALRRVYLPMPPFDDGFSLYSCVRRLPLSNELRRAHQWLSAYTHPSLSTIQSADSRSCAI